MPKGRQIFKRRDLTRAIKGVQAAGREILRAEIDSVTGKIVLILNKSDASTGNPNEWDGAEGLKIRLQFIHEYCDRHGKVRRYFRRPGFKELALPGLPGSEEFMAAYQDALAGQLPRIEIGASRSKPGSLDALIASYLVSDTFKSLADETQRMRRNILDKMRTNHGGKMVAALLQRHVVAMLEKKKVHAQKNWLKTIRGLMLYAIKENYRPDDPTAGLKAAKPAVRSRGHMTWGAPQIAAYRERHAVGTMARVAIELLLNIASRRGDAHKLGVQHMQDGKIRWRPQKTIRSTGKELSIRILPEFQRTLDAMPNGDGKAGFPNERLRQPVCVGGSIRKQVCRLVQ
jgi:hypothetical protein